MNNLLGSIKDVIGLNGVPDAYTMIMNLGQHIEPVKYMVLALAWMLSLFVLISAIRKLAAYGEGNNQETGAMGICLMFVFSIFLFYLPSLLQSMSMTVFGDVGNALAYTATGQTSQKVANAMAVIYKFIGIAGLIAVVNGIMNMKAVAEGTSRDGYSKGFWHLVGGWAALHLDDLMKMLKLSAGFS